MLKLPYGFLCQAFVRELLRELPFLLFFRQLSAVTLDSISRALVPQNAVSAGETRGQV
jgi:hypothetical protein